MKILDILFGRKSTASAPQESPPAASGTPTVPRIWVPDPAIIPWFEKPGAIDKVPEIAARWNLGPDGEAWLGSWVRDGYFVVDDAVPEAVIDAFSAKIDDAWFREAPYEGMSVSDVVVDGVKRVHTPMPSFWPCPLKSGSRRRRNLTGASASIISTSRRPWRSFAPNASA